jgi:RNA polymerase sigma-70 factor (ECF subfamily)
MQANQLNVAYSRYLGDAQPESVTALYNALRQYVAQVTRNHNLADAEDATGDIVAEVWRSLPGYRGVSSFSTWVHNLSRSSIIDRIRQERRRPNLIGEDGEYRTAGTSSSAPIYMDADNLVTLTEAERELVRQLIACPDYDELAEKLCISNIALRSRFARIRKKCETQRCVSVAADD